MKVWSAGTNVAKKNFNKILAMLNKFITKAKEKSEQDHLEKNKEILFSPRAQNHRRNSQIISFNINTPANDNSASRSLTTPEIMTSNVTQPNDLDDLAIEEFFTKIEKFDKPERIYYLSRLHQEYGKDEDVVLLTNQQLASFIKFITKNRKIIEYDLAKLSSGESLRIARKNLFRQDRYQNHDHLPFTLEFEKNNDSSISIYALPKSKLADYSKKPTHKHLGTTKSVSPKILLNPIDKQTKLLLEVSKKNTSVFEAEREGLMLTAIFGSQYKIGQVYRDSQHMAAINSSELAALSSLTQFITPRSRDDLFKKDINYNSEYPESSAQKIISNLVHDMLINIKQIHDAGVIHNDIKDSNVLVFIDQQGNLRARISDFGLSIYQKDQKDIEEWKAQEAILLAKFANKKIDEKTYSRLCDTLQKDAECTQPVATAEYAAPQVAGFTLQNEKENPEKLTFPSLCESFNDKYHNDIDPAIFACQLLESTELQGADFVNLRSDYKDDMFSLGITIYMLITGHYPCIKHFMNEEVAFELESFNLKYLAIDTALEQYPLLHKIEEVIRNILTPTREERFSATQALESFEKAAKQKAKRSL